MSNISAINKLKSALKNKWEYGNDGFEFRGLITYTSKGKTVTEILQTILIIGGYEPLVRIDSKEEGEIITSDDYHMDFNPKFFKTSTFEFDYSTEILTIKGSSPKMGGDYFVEIQEA